MLSLSTSNIIARVPAWVKALRPEQWVKNAFVLAPLLFGRRIGDLPAVERTLVAFGAFCLTASAVYLVNDLLDRREDRDHPRKRHRPIASGAISPAAAVTMAALLSAAGLSAAGAVDAVLLALLAAYAGANLAYSLWLKRIVIVDVMVVASGFVLRVLGGAAAAGVWASPWILVCTGLLALFLGFAKRRQELVRTVETGERGRAVLEHYDVAFLDVVQAVLAGATLIAYTLYTVAPHTVASVGDHRMLLTAPFVAHGLLRYLWVMHVRGGGENPTRVALTDPGTVLTVLLWVGTSALLLHLG